MYYRVVVRRVCAFIRVRGNERCMCAHALILVKARMARNGMRASVGVPKLKVEIVGQRQTTEALFLLVVIVEIIGLTLRLYADTQVVVLINGVGHAQFQSAT